MTCFGWADVHPTVAYTDSEIVESEDIRYFGLVTYKAFSNYQQNPNQWLGKKKGFISTYENKKDAFEFLSKMEAIEAYSKIESVDILSFEIKSNISSITNSLIGSSHWLNSLLATVNDALIYTDTKQIVHRDIIETAIKAQQELIENKYLLMPKG